MSGDRLKELDDTSPMPFGKYKGMPMSDVPASYLHWFWVNGGDQDYRSSVSDYIRRNIHVLKREYDNGIW